MNKPPKLKSDRASKLLSLYLDGLDAAVDGRGWGKRHQSAYDQLVVMINNYAALMDVAEFASDLNCVKEDAGGDGGCLHCCAVKALAQAEVKP